MNIALPRRHFLKLMGTSAGGLALGLEFVDVLAADSVASGAQHTLSAGPWIRIDQDGTTTIVVDKSEMGQGVLTSLPMLIAEELDADWNKVKVEQAPAAPEYKHPWFGVQATGGSTSVRAMWQPLREAGATARALLIQAAALTWKMDASALRTEAGQVCAPDGQCLGYGALSALAATLPLPKQVGLKNPADFKIIGQSIPRTDLIGKVNGAAQFGIDVRVPGMLFASVERSPVLGGKVKSFDASAALAIQGVRQVHSIQSPTAAGVAVLADHSWAAKKGREALKIEWDQGAHAHFSTASMKEEMVALAKSKTGAKVARLEGQPETIQEGTLLKAVYDVPFLAHATMEPMNATAWVKEDGVTIWAPTQAPGPNQFVAASIAGCKPSQVKVHTTLLGGGFGRRFSPDFIAEAVSLSKLAKAPVQVLYSREDDMKGQYYRPAARAELSVRLDQKGNPNAFQGVTVTDSIADGTGFEAALINKEGIDNTAVEGLYDFPYDIPHFKLEWVRHQPGVRNWFWRSVGSTENGFFTESFIDEMAYAAGKDPFEYRRGLLSKKPRHLAVLERAAKESGWGSPLPQGRARGIAVCESFGSFVAEVAEISLINGMPKVHKVTIAADVGIVVNPDIVRAQMEGAMIYGLTAALYGKITYAEGQVEQSNFGDYPVMRLSETPEVSVHLISSAEAPGGVGEPGTPPIAPAVANAVFALTKKRIRSLPLSDAQLV
jgi:isoquinoline 1-oxidoreductase subunit beta